MGEYNPNDAQKKFLGTTGCNVLVSASAGSGKTSTMIQKLVGLLDKYKLPISSLLVVTFTNAAAAEIRQRLYMAISEKLSTITDTKDRDYFKKQLDNISNAEIGTLHSICKKLITKYFYVIEQSPEFSLISEKDASYLYDLAIDRVFKKRIIEKDGEFFELYNSYNSDRSDSNLKDLISKLKEFASSRPDFKEWLKITTAGSYNLDLDKNTACQFVLNDYQSIFKSMTLPLEQMKKEAAILGLNKQCEFLSKWLQFIDEFSKAKKFSQGLKIYNDFKPPKKPQVSSKATAEEEDYDVRLVSLITDIKKNICEKFDKALSSRDYNAIREGIDIVGKNLNTILSLLEDINAEYDREKKAKGEVDFNDLEKLMLDILDNDTVRRELQDTYKFIFFDEYQDINDKQELILSKLTTGDNYYMIGDVKQSIYAFRQASPKIFVSKFQKYQSDGKNNVLINFNQNYRSERNILGFANQVFDTLITKDNIGIDYKESARFETDKDFVGAKVKINILDIYNSTCNRLKAESLLIAREIADIMQKKKADGNNFDYRDICIIVRSKGDFVLTLTKVLSELQIPVTTELDTEFFKSNEIRVLVSVLKVLSNFKDDLSVATSLKTLFGMSEEELLIVREQSTSKYYHDAVSEYNANDEIKAKIDGFMNFIDQYRMYLANHTIAETLWNIIDTFDLLNYYKSLPGGLERENNILEFISFSDSEKYKYNLDKFLEYLDFASKDKIKQTIGAKGNAVEICTIHHSKGLEYPAVILAGIGRQFLINKDSSNIIINNNYGIGIKGINPEDRIATETIVRAACKGDSARSEYDEEIRLLYVAMTRPREYLSITGTYDMSMIKYKTSKPIYSQNCLFDMILKSFTSEEISKMAALESYQIMNEGNDNESTIEIIPAEFFSSDEEDEKTEVVISRDNVQLYNAIKDMHNAKPNNETFTIKNTVTNIMREETDYENLISTPEKLKVTDKVGSIDFLKLGTAYHTIMQSVNFNESKEDIETLISGLVSEGLIDRDLVLHIKVEEIVAAIKTIGEYVRLAKNVYREKQFLLCENYNKLVKNSDNNTKVIVQGIIDLVIVTDSDAILIDYKTNKTNDAKLLIDEYSLQLDIYKSAFEAATGIKITKKYLYSFYQKTLIEVV